MTRYSSLLSPGFDRIGDLKTIVQDAMGDPRSGTFDYTKMFFNIIVIGAGGTGGYVIRDLSRFIFSIQKRRDDFAYRFVVVDGDIVEEKNLLRQNFLPRDLGKSKSVCIAERHAKAFGLGIEAYNTRVENRSTLKDIVDSYGESPLYNGSNRPRIVNIVIGCVDNNKARRVVDDYMNSVNASHSNFIWIDSGNERKGGQVVCGGKVKTTSGDILNIPTVTDLYPEILEEAEDSTSQVSCAERLMQDEQNIFVNISAAMYVLNFIRKIVLSEDFQIHGVEFDINGKVASRHLSEAA